MANKNLGDLIFDLALDDKKFQSAIERAISTIKQLNSAVVQMSGSMSASFKSAATDASTLVKELSKANRQITKMATPSAVAPKTPAAAKTSPFPIAPPTGQFKPWYEAEADGRKRKIIETSAIYAQKLREDAANAKKAADAAVKAEEQKRKEAEKTRIAGEREAKKLADTQIQEAKRAADAQKKINSDAKDQMVSNAASVASSIEKLGAVAVAAFAAIGYWSASSGATFQQEIQAAAVISGAEFETLAEKAQQFGRDTKFSANEVAVAMRNFAQAGLKTGEIIAATDASISLASASNSDLAASSQLVATTMRQFGLIAAETADVADIFTFAMNNSKLDIESLTQSMKYAGTVGKGLGMSLEDTSAAIMMLADIGNVGSKSGTVFRLAMMRASATTAEADRILQSYGLTQKDINPETKRFGEILDVIAKKQMSVSEATRIFGLQAGASMVTLARQQKLMQSLGRSYEDLVSNMKKATAENLAAQNAAKMLDTVMGQFTQLKSSIETLGKMTFFAYAEQLQLLLEAAKKIVNDVITYFDMASEHIRTTFGSAIERLTGYLTENSHQITGFIIRLIGLFGNLGAQLTNLAPTFLALAQHIANFVIALDKVVSGFLKIVPIAESTAELLFRIWEVSKLITFLSWLSKLPAQFAAVKLAIRAMTAELTVATGGLYALAALGGIAVFSMIGKDAEDTTNRVEELAAATQFAANVTGNWAKKESESIASVLAASQKYYREAQKNRVSLTDAEKAESKELLEMNANLAEAQIQTGRLAILNGKLVTTTRLASEAMADNGVGTKNVDEAVRGLHRRMSDLLTVSDQMKLSLQAAQYASKGVTDQQKRSQVMYDSLPATYRKVFNSFAEFAAAQKAVEERANKGREAEDALRNQIAKTAITVDDTAEAELEREQKRKESDEAAKQRLQEQLDLLALIRAEIDKSISDQQDALLAALATEDQARELSIAKQIDAEKARYDERIKKLKEAGLSEQQYADEAALAYEHLQTAIGVIGVTTTAQIAKELDKRITDVSKSLETEAQLRRDAREKRRLDELGALEVDRVAETIALQNTIGLEKDGAAAVAAAKLEIDKKYRLLSAAIDLKYNKEQRDEAVATAEKTFDIKLRGEEQFGQEVAAIEKQRSTEAQRIQQEAKDKIKSIDEQYAKSVDELVKQGLMTAKEAEDAKLLFAKQTAAERKAIEDDAAKRAREVMTPYEKLRKAFAGMFGEDAGKALDNLKKKFEEMGGVGKRIAQIIAQVFKGAFGVIKGGFDTVMNVVQQISGFSLNILGTIQDAIGFVQSEQKAAIEDASERAKAAGFDPAMAERRAAAATQPDDLATKFVDDLVGGAVRITELFVAVVGPVISELAAQLPSLFTAVANAIPQIVTAFAQNIGPLVAAIVQGVPMVAIALIEAIPTIATALVDAIFFDLIPALPGIAWELLKAILDAAWETIKSLAQMIWDALTGSSEPDTGGPAAYSGMDYVPSTMRATLHQGEAVIPADRNARRLRGSTAPAPAGADQNYGGRGGMGGFGPLEVSVIAEGRLLEAVQLRAEDMGRATGMAKRIRKAAGTKVGFSRGDYNPWSR